MSQINFSNITLLGKGTNRKSTKGGTRASGFDIRYANYTKTTKNGDVLVNSLIFSADALNKTGLNSESKAATPFVADGVVGVMVLSADNPNATFLKPSKRGNKKSKMCTVPSLVKALNDAGIISADFNGSQFLELTEIGKDENATYFQITASTTLAPKVYVPGEEVTDEEAISNTSAM